MRFCSSCGTRYPDDLGFCPQDGLPTQPLDAEVVAPDSFIGRVIDGRYRIEEQIGEGGMGVVYRATHIVLNKRLALKILRGDMARDQDVVQRFMQEAQAASSIGHANIIDISDFGQLPEGAVYFVMEFLEGDPLSALVENGGSVPVRIAVQIVEQIASALGAAHARGIVHRDLKPDNVFVIKRKSDAPFVKVLDFGIAKVGGAASKLTKTGMIFGTPHYMSPEQAAGQTVDARTDIYALGVIMYEMFTGKVPFDADTFMGILSKHMFEPPVPPSQLDITNTQQLGALEEVVLKALAKKPENRYQSMEDLITDIEAVLKGGPALIAQRAPVPSVRPGASRGTHGDLDSAHPGAKKRTVPIIIGAILCLLVLVGVGVYASIGGSDERAQARTTTSLPSNVPAPVPVANPAPPLAQGTDPAPAEALVSIETTPPGAQVLISGAIVGNTPVRIDRPAPGDASMVELRLRGYFAETVRVDRTSPETINVALREEEEAPTKQKQVGGRTKGRRTGTQATQAETPQGTDNSRPRSVTSEVVDPWGN